MTELFDRCLGLAPAEREQILAIANATVSCEVRSLLENADPDLESFLSPVDQILSPSQGVPQQIGAYRIERLLGQGGMGTVFLARRVGEFDQLVAVKLIRRDFGSAADSLAIRFRQERQILATLQHPYIAHLIDGGTSDAHPYLVVEYVPGLRIDEYCNVHHLAIRQRIELFLKVCGAVQYAHQNLIVHRDLKPANVLVLDDGTPRLLDFGIAKLLSDDNSAPNLTRTEMRVFTPTYASPEQLRGERVGTASDVYSLGVMLYELLTGQKPHLVNADSEYAVLDAVCRQTPPSASAAIKRYSGEEKEARAAERKTAYASWGKALRNDLDLVLSKAISADICRRYQSVEQFASDLNRYLAHLPITARKDTWIYRAQKFWSRHKALVSVAAAAILLVLAAGLALLREYRIAIQQKQRAERRFDDLHALAKSNVTEVQDALDRIRGGTEVRALILQRTVQYLDSLAAEKDNDINLQRDLASTYQILAQRLGNPASGNLGDTAGANANYDRSIRIRESIVAQPQSNEKDKLQLIEVRRHKGLMQFSAGHLEAARQTLVEAANASDAILAGNPHDIIAVLILVSMTHRSLADILEDDAESNLADPVQALRHADTALEAARKAYERQPSSLNLLWNLINVQETKAHVLAENGHAEEGMNLEKSTLDLAKESSGHLTAAEEQILLFTTYKYGLMISEKDPLGARPWLDGPVSAVVSARASDPADMKMAGWSAIGMTMAGNVHRLAGERAKGLKMMDKGMGQLTGLLAKSPAAAGQLYFALAAGYRGLADEALKSGKTKEAIREYQNADRVYAEDGAKIPDDLGVYAKRSENQLSLAVAEAKLGMAKQAAADRKLALEYADRVLRIHPDNPEVQKLKLRAIAMKN